MQEQTYEEQYLQKQREEEQEEIIQKKRKQKKKRKNQKVLFTNFNNLTDKQMLLTFKEMRERIRHHFIWHIGRENSTNKVAIFESIMGMHPMDLDIFRRAYWWKIIDMLLKEMKRDDELFVVRRGQSYYVLSSMEEADYYRDQIDHSISNYQKSKDQAYDWVKKKKYKNLSG
jgi:hypothetical protein